MSAAAYWIKRGLPFRIDYRDDGLTCLQRAATREQAEQLADDLRADLATEVTVRDLREELSH